MDIKIVSCEEARPVSFDGKRLYAGRIRHTLVLELPDGTRTKVQVSEAFYSKYLGFYAAS